jgi:hypothetical protein
LNAENPESHCIPRFQCERMDTQETIVRLKILSRTLTPEMITAKIGLQCDKWWHAGDFRGHTIIVQKEHGWVLHSGLPKTTDLDTHIKVLLDILEPAKEAIRGISITETVEFSIVIYSSSEPALCFDPPIISRIAGLGAGLDIDLYVSKEGL